MLSFLRVGQCQLVGKMRRMGFGLIAWAPFQRRDTGGTDVLEVVALSGHENLVARPCPTISGTVVIRGSAVDSALIKSSQIDTVTETLEAMRIRPQTGWSQMASHRSGGADDGFIADLAFGSGRGQVKR